MRSFTPVLKNMLARGLLALAFLFAQQTASLHWLSHAVEATQHKNAKAPAADHCDECLALSALGAAAPAHAAALPFAAAQHAPLAAPIAAASQAALRLAFRSRAPPILV
ncbi:MAG TPA: hypothetical protein VFA35_04810 [Burkholderiaceae bacterium]|nr:hypothetical protein [Burkholderiaceae bacterium]